ncbi:hypothetical protein B0A55_07641 [Friedmanniomyces simplex]|uniref:Uncharacterized protein n=1 Tax=Friedmanniomyces simplex TaxID=329884 RepID=A0A4V5NHE8_9PEZI|nr:hypothetical protein B0A55_07641 [Friedmanniomyces simplex]
MEAAANSPPSITVTVLDTAFSVLGIGSIHLVVKTAFYAAFYALSVSTVVFTTIATMEIIQRINAFFSPWQPSKCETIQGTQQRAAFAKGLEEVNEWVEVEGTKCLTSLPSELPG